MQPGTAPFRRAFWVGLTQPPSAPWDVSPLAISLVFMGGVAVPLVLEVARGGCGGVPPRPRAPRRLLSFVLWLARSYGRGRLAALLGWGLRPYSPCSSS